MSRIQLSCDIQASPEQVFAAAAHPEHFRQIVPDVQQIEFLTDTRSGVGTRFRETRVHLNMHAKAHNWKTRWANFKMRKSLREALAADLERVRAYLESGQGE